MVCLEKMGVKTKKLLKPEAIPTIFIRPNTVSKPKRQSTAVIIRERARVRVIDKFIMLSSISCNR